MRFSFEASDAVGSQWHTSANRLMLNLPISDRTSFGAVGSLRAFPGADGGVRAVGRRCGFFRGQVRILVGAVAYGAGDL